MADIKSKAGHVLTKSDDPEARSLAAYVLGSVDTPQRSEADLKALLAKIDGREGQKERADDVRRQLAVYG